MTENNIVRAPERRRPPVDLRALEDEVGHAVREAEHIAAREPDLGRLAADAVMATVEHAAQEVEKLGLMVKELAPKLEEAMQDLDKSLKTISEAAKVIRDKGERTKLLVEAANRLATEIGVKCTEFTKMVNGDG